MKKLRFDAKKALLAAGSAVFFAVVWGLYLLFDARGKEWYQGLAKSAMRPPEQVFDIVWPVMFALLAVLLYLAISKGFAGAGALCLLSGALVCIRQLVFYTLKSPAGALVLTGALLIAGVALFLKSSAGDARAGMPAAVYVLWVSFEFVLYYDTALVN